MCVCFVSYVCVCAVRSFCISLASYVVRSLDLYGFVSFVCSSFFMDDMSLCRSVGRSLVRLRCMGFFRVVCSCVCIAYVM